jgi:hypothetical protein
MVRPSDGLKRVSKPGSQDRDTSPSNLLSHVASPGAMMFSRSESVASDPSEPAASVERLLKAYRRPSRRSSVPVGRLRLAASGRAQM